MPGVDFVINADAFKNQSVSAAAAALHKLADDYYAWRNENYPVRSSEAGLHTWDDRLTDYSPGKIAERAQHIRSLLDRVRAMKTDNWPKDERIDWILFRAQLENAEFGDRVLKFEFTNQQVYTDECTNAILSDDANPGKRKAIVARCGTALAGPSRSVLIRRRILAGALAACRLRLTIVR